MRRRTSRPAERPSPPDQGSAPLSSSPTPVASGPGHPARGRTRRAGGPAWALGLALVALTGAPALAAPGGKPAYVERGEASYYGPGLHGRRMADGRRLDRRRLTAAHRVLPLGSRATVTNLANGKQVEVEISDRGPCLWHRSTGG